MTVEAKRPCAGVSNQNPASLPKRSRSPGVCRRPNGFSRTTDGTKRKALKNGLRSISKHLILQIFLGAFSSPLATILMCHTPPIPLASYKQISLGSMASIQFLVCMQVNFTELPGGICNQYSARMASPFKLCKPH